MLIKDAKPLCLHLAQKELRDARIILGTIGTKPSNDAANLISRRKKVELAFDYYLDKRATESRQSFSDIVTQIQYLRNWP